MSGKKSGATKIILILLVLIVAVGGGLYALNNLNNSPAASSSNNTTNKNAATDKNKNSEEYVETEEFKYLVPGGWAKVDPDQLQSAGAVSGIATVSLPITQFRVAVEPASTSPDSLDSFKQATLQAIQKFQNFKIITEGPIEVSGQNGYRYTYKLGSDNMAQQDFIIVLHKDKAFSLLFTGPESNFKSQAPVLNKIISSFQLL